MRSEEIHQSIFEAIAIRTIRWHVVWKALGVAMLLFIIVAKFAVRMSFGK